MFPALMSKYEDIMPQVSESLFESAYRAYDSIDYRVIGVGKVSKMHTFHDHYLLSNIRDLELFGSINRWRF
jgi:hypothetical protein